MKIERKWIAAVLALLFSFALLVGPAGRVWAEDPTTAVNRFNVVLVIDKSGSLRNLQGDGTDPDGLRFDAIKLFLGLLTESGNNVGAVVFDQEIRYDSGLKPMNGMAAKKRLIEAVESFGTGYDTDIGGAVLRATEILQGMREKNGLPCVILLLTDGKTDFSEGYYWPQMRRSYALAQQALTAAQNEGITIYGILLNVNNIGKGGEIELQLYTDGTGGAFEEVGTPEDLSAAFKRFYSVINGTEYSGTQKIAFSLDGTAQTEFVVPRFGLEEVNVVIEHESVTSITELGEITQVTITQPDGAVYETAGQEIQSSRYMLIKIPRPMPGRWNVRLSGEPEDTVDICMIYNPSMTVVLRDEDAGQPFEVLRPHRFRAEIADAEEQFITEEDLKNIEACLLVHSLATDEYFQYPMEAEGTGYFCDLTLERGGDFTATAQVGLGDFAVRSNTVEAVVVVPPPVARISGVSNMLTNGLFHDGLWEFSFAGLFEDPKGTQLRYSLSDDLGGALKLDGEVLQARLKGIQSASFALRATDAYGMSAEIPFNLTVPSPVALVGSVTDMPGIGTLRDDAWELSLDRLFEDPKGTALRYSLADGFGGAVSIDGSLLSVSLRGLRHISFTVRATDEYGLSVDLPFDLDIPTIISKVSQVTDMLRIGQFRDDAWEVELSELFAAPDWVSPIYSLSDDYDGAITVTDGILRARFDEEDEVYFTLTASDGEGNSADIPFDIEIPGPTARYEEIRDMFSLGSFRDNVWELPLDGLFGDPKGTVLRYRLSDDCKGAVTVEDDVLRVRLSDLKRARFDLEATDAFSLSAETYFDLTPSLPVPAVSGVNNMLSSGRFHDELWELELDGLFTDTNGAGLTYTLSDDFDGALRLTDAGTLELDYPELKAADFTLTATDGHGLSAELPFSLRVPGPAPRTGSLSAEVKTGLFQEGTWEHEIEGLFTEPKGSAMTYSLSDDMNGAVTLSDGRIKANCKGLGVASFSLIATDSYGLTGQIPVTLTEKNMTPLFLLIGLGVLLLLVGLAVLFIFLYRRSSCGLKITVSRFTPEGSETLATVNGFHKRRSLKDLGEILGVKGEDLSFLVTGDHTNCVFQGKQPFYVNRRTTKSRSAMVSSGAKLTITFEPDAESGIEIEAQS